MALATWFMFGTFVDAWAHANLAVLESFFTPWHGLMYSGFLATGAWIAWQVRRLALEGRVGRDAVPVGYGWGLIGLGVFALGGLGDMLWHTVFGIEQGIAAAVSPTHQILLAGMLLFLSSPFRAAWTADPPGHRPSYREFLPALLSLAFTATNSALVVVFLTTFLTGAPAGGFGEGIGSILITTVLLVAPVLLVARRWQPPFGTVTTVWTIMAAFLGAISEWSNPEQLGAVALAGLAVDLLLRRAPLRVTGFFAPLLLWGAWFTATAATQEVTWPVELWSGSIVWAGMLGLALSLLMAATPSAQPVADAGAGSPEPEPLVDARP